MRNDRLISFFFVQEDIELKCVHHAFEIFVQRHDNVSSMDILLSIATNLHFSTYCMITTCSSYILVRQRTNLWWRKWYLMMSFFAMDILLFMAKDMTNIHFSTYYMITTYSSYILVRQRTNLWRRRWYLMIIFSLYIFFSYEKKYLFHLSSSKKISN